MAKQKTVFVCQECGHESPKWMGQCICGAWNSYVEEKILTVSPLKKASDTRSRDVLLSELNSTTNKPLSLKNIKSNSALRIDTGIAELNRVLGGGIVEGSLTLISGEPGIGKSTLILQTSLNLAKTYGTVLYVSGEESEAQIKIRADRIDDSPSDRLFLLSETNIENISTQVTNLMEEDKKLFLVIDSIQTMYTDSIDSAAGTVSQVRTCCNELMKLGKVLGIPIFIVAHVTKSGELAGPKIIEHLVDAVLLFNGDRKQDIRILRAIKNRFGTTSEIGAFEMTDKGMVEIYDIAATFIENMESESDGTLVSATYEGSRPILVELQALTARSTLNYPRRTPIGVELARLNMILAVLERKAGLNLSTYDVYINIVGGLRPDGTTTDLAVALALYSSAKNIIIPKGTIAFGEIGLTGDLRSIKNADKIINEAIKLGYTNIILPKKNADFILSSKNKSLSSQEIKIIGIKNIQEALLCI